MRAYESAIAVCAPARKLSSMDSGIELGGLLLAEYGRAMVRIGLVQLAVNGTDDIDGHLTRALDITRSAAADADLVMLPELWSSGAFDLSAGLAHAQPIDGPFVTRLSELAAATDTWIHGGSFVESADDGLYNTSVLFDSSGALVASYRKIHLFGFDGLEAATLSAGKDLIVLDTPLGRTGLATCYDLRFPELFRGLVDRGATAVLLTSGWPQARIGHWQVLAKARAIENQCWVAGCNETGTHAGVELGGASVVVDPWGTVVAAGADQETVVFADIDPDLPVSVREGFPVLRDRKL